MLLAQVLGDAVTDAAPSHGNEAAPSHGNEGEGTQGWPLSPGRSLTDGLGDAMKEAEDVIEEAAQRGLRGHSSSARSTTC